MRCVFCGYCAFRRCWALLWKNRLNRRLLEKRRCLIVSVSSASGRNCKSCWVAPFAHLALQGRREVWQVVLPEWQKAQGQDRLDTLPQDAFLRLIWLYCAADCSPVGAMKRLKCPDQQQQRGRGSFGSCGSNRRRGYILCDKHCAVMGVDWCRTILRCVLLPTKSMDRQRSSLPERVMAVGAFRS